MAINLYPKSVVLFVLPTARDMWIQIFLVDLIGYAIIYVKII